jgi:hypothetical protein
MTETRDAMVATVRRNGLKALIRIADALEVPLADLSIGLEADKPLKPK